MRPSLQNRYLDGGKSSTEALRTVQPDWSRLDAVGRGSSHTGAGGSPSRQQQAAAILDGGASSSTGGGAALARLGASQSLSTRPGIASQSGVPTLAGGGCGPGTAGNRRYGAYNAAELRADGMKAGIEVVRKPVEILTPAKIPIDTRLEQIGIRYS